MKLLKHKKSQMTIVGMVANLLIGALTMILGDDLPPEVRASILEIVAWAMLALPAVFAASQGVSDGLSNGATATKE
jgi:hypothetical protein